MTTLYTIGHSNRSIDEFVGLLQDARVRCLVDVRAQPYSRRHPQFRREALREALAGAGIKYRWEGRALGGHRQAGPGSRHLALTEGFRGYADHMETAEFAEALERVRTLAAEMQGVALMCAEALPQNCHRALIADALVQAGYDVTHLLGCDETRTHSLSVVARWDGKRLVYDRGSRGELL